MLLLRGVLSDSCNLLYIDLSSREPAVYRYCQIINLYEVASYLFRFSGDYYVISFSKLFIFKRYHEIS